MSIEYTYHFVVQMPHPARQQNVLARGREHVLRRVFEVRFLQRRFVGFFLRHATCNRKATRLNLKRHMDLRHRLVARRFRGERKKPNNFYRFFFFFHDPLFYFASRGWIDLGERWTAGRRGVIS